MGTTLSNLHIIKPGAESKGVHKHIVQAYSKLGYERSKRPSRDAVKQTAVTSTEGLSPSFSLFDSTNEDIDSGELKEMAVHLSKSLKTVVIVASVYDSDHAEAIIYVSGKQADAVMTDAQGHGGNLTILAGKARARKWREWFNQLTWNANWLRNPELAQKELQEQESRFAAKLDRILKPSGPFAEDLLAELCELAGIPPANALRKFSDFKENSEEDAPAEMLFFERKASAETAPNAHPGQTKLEFYLSEDDCPYHLLYPASWPILPTEPARVQWLITSVAAGFGGCRITCHLNGAVTAEVTKIHLIASPFYNGQITSMTPLAHVEGVPIREANPTEYSVAFDQFAVPDVLPESRKQILLQLYVELAAADTEDFTCQLSLLPSEKEAEAPVLPPLNISVIRPAWLPVVSGLDPRLNIKTFNVDKDPKEQALEMGRTFKAYQVKLLNHSAIVSGTAIFPDASQATVDAARIFAENWHGMLKADGCELRIHTQKHMTAAAHVGKATKQLPLRAVISDKLWPKLFDAGSNYQTVQLGLVPQGYNHPVAGLVMQYPLSEFGRFGAALPTLHVSQWAANSPASETLTGTSIAALTEKFDSWVSGREVLQAWITQTAQIPLLDLYEGFHQTLYEDACLFNWFHSGLMGTLTSREWCTQKLRFVAPLMWMHRELQSRLDSEKLMECADVTQQGNVFRVAKKPGATMNHLEFALLPILPIEKERLV